MSKTMAHNAPYALDVPELGAYGVAPGEPVEVDDQHLRGRLRRQHWVYVGEDDDPDDMTLDDVTETDEEDNAQ